MIVNTKKRPLFEITELLKTDLRCLILLAFLRELTSLYHSLTQKGKN